MDHAVVSIPIEKAVPGLFQPLPVCKVLKTNLGVLFFDKERRVIMTTMKLAT